MTSKLLAISSFVLAVGTARAFAQSPTTAPATTAPTLNQSRTPHRKPVPGVIDEMTTKQLGNFDYDEKKGGIIPADVTALDGVTIRLRGYMIPMDQADKIQTFALVWDPVMDGTHPGPSVQQLVVVNAPKGKPVDYLPDLVLVEGELHVRVKEEDGDIVSIFDLDATSIRPLAPAASHGPSTQPKSAG